MEKKWVYFFGEGDTKNKALLGGKGANLGEMTKIGLPVPPGFTISTEACVEFYKKGKKHPEGLDGQIWENVKKLEEKTGKKFGAGGAPLLVSVRSGAKISMPGMMDTILNLGMNDRNITEMIKKTGDERFVYDSYRRLVQMFGEVVMGVPFEKFDPVIEKAKEKKGVKFDTELTAEDWKKIIEKFKKAIKDHTGKEFPQDAREQLMMSIDAVFNSWNVPRAVTYRRIHKIPDDLGTAVNVQTMVFGNMGNDSASGVGFTRNPATGEKEYYGEYLVNAQGEDVVAGIRTPKHLNDMENGMPDIYRHIVDICKKLEDHYKEMQDYEFTIENGKLYMLQTRDGKRTAAAAVKIAVDMVKEKLIDKKTAVLRIDPNMVDQLLHDQFDPKEKEKVKTLAKGLPASPGAAFGQIVFNAEDAHKWAEDGKKVILVRTETSPDDIQGMVSAKGILTSRGGLTSHAAVVARGMGKCCVCGAGDIQIDYSRKLFKAGDIVVKEGEYISLDGSTGEVFIGEMKTVKPELKGEFGEFMEWVDSFRKLKVKTNADTPHDSKVARDFGAQGIGLCRTEHMFFEGDRIKAVREMILSSDEAGRKKALDKLKPLQKGDFYNIFEVMEGLPVTIRLLDPPLHEFLPQTEKDIKEMAKEMGVSEEQIKEKVESLHEANPMLGHRGCRLGITYPEIYEMQFRAIFEAAKELKGKGKNVIPEIMIPLVGHENELGFFKDLVIKVAKDVLQGTDLKYKFGTMIELPRGSMAAEKIAKYADFFSFGTNDLTQTTFGFSRDDVGKFIGEYIDKKILPVDPFQVLDQDGVGQLMKFAVVNGRKGNPKLEVGICGEHGGEPSSVEFCHRIGLDYVSCSPYRVPIARIAAAQAVLKEKNRK